MKLSIKLVKAVVPCLLVLGPLFMSGRLEAKNQILGQIELEAANKPAKNSGVWIDGQYVGFVKELKGSKKILLLPGKHQVDVRQNGYQNFTQEVDLLPGQRQIVAVAMQKDLSAQYGTQSALVKISGRPERAAVFVDKQFVGHINQFNGLGHGMLLTPGTHDIKVSLPGYRTFETQVTLQPRQKLKLKTDLMQQGQSFVQPTANR
ncbi:MAG TPA: PEGA domain-containing protein [Terriglobia bacterium]|nr:PEGA domain-containing protein [Terriglobia bacterium]